MHIIEWGAILMFFLAFYGLVISRKMIKSIVYTVMMEGSVIMFFLSLGFRNEIAPPIGRNLEDLPSIADPLPQALMLTAIIIGVAITTVKITMLMAIFRKYKTTDWDQAKKFNREWIVDRSTEE